MEWTMKVAGELLILAREHHTALSLADKCINAAKSTDKTEIESLCLEISQNFKMDYSEHFDTEETTIFAFLSAETAELSQLCDQLTLEHQQLYKMAGELETDSGLLEEFGQLMKSHSRTEDTEIFPKIELLSATQRREILLSSAKHAAVIKA